MDIATVIHLDGAADWLTTTEVLAQFDRDDPGEEIGWLTRWRDFVDAGLHVASATDAPWTFPDAEPGGRADHRAGPSTRSPRGIDGPWFAATRRPRRGCSTRR